MRRRAVRTWPVQVPRFSETRIRIPVMHIRAQALKAWGKRSGFVDVLDEPTAHIADLDETKHELELLLVERSSVGYRETLLPEAADECIGAFFDEDIGSGFLVFTVRKGVRSSGRKRQP